MARSDRRQCFIYSDLLLTPLCISCQFSCIPSFFVNSPFLSFKMSESGNTGVGVSSCCLSGKVKEGQPKGRVEAIAGLQTYVAEPKDGSKKMTVIFLVDSMSTALLLHALG